MIVSLDFDDTFTADPETWTKVVNALTQAGHEVICISGRANNDENKIDLRSNLPKQITRIYLCGDLSKKHYSEINSLQVDVWIDDSPSRIVQAKQRVIRSLNGLRVK